MTVAKNGSGLHAQSNVESSNSSNEQRAKQGQQQRGGNSRSSRAPVSGSPPSAPRHRHHQQQQQKQSRQLPIRSKNIDLSQYLASLSLNNNTMPSDSSTSKAASTNGSNTSSGDMKCAFCENNRESREVYTSHNLKDSLGKIVCPILRNFVCPKCGESGDYAHTDKYCPVTQRKHKENKIRKFFSSTATSTSSVAATSSFHH